MRERTFATLDKYIIMDDVSSRTDGPSSAASPSKARSAGTVIAEASGLALKDFPNSPIAEVQIDGVPCHLIRRSHFGGLGAEIIAPRKHLALLWHNLHASVHAEHGASHRHGAR